MSRTLPEKLLLKPGGSLRVLRPPGGYAEGPGPLPAGASLTSGGPADVVQLFCANQGALADGIEEGLEALAPGGVLWCCYPKQSSKVPTDLTRDRGWEELTRRGWRVVSSIAVDEVWSGLRFMPSH